MSLSSKWYLTKGLSNVIQLRCQLNDEFEKSDTSSDHTFTNRSTLSLEKKLCACDLIDQCGNRVLLFKDTNNLCLLKVETLKHVRQEFYAIRLCDGDGLSILCLVDRDQVEDHCSTGEHNNVRDESTQLKPGSIIVIHELSFKPRVSSKQHIACLLRFTLVGQTVLETAPHQLTPAPSSLLKDLTGSSSSSSSSRSSSSSNHHQKKKQIDTASLVIDDADGGGGGGGGGEDWFIRLLLCEKRVWCENEIRRVKLLFRDANGYVEARVRGGHLSLQLSLQLQEQYVYELTRVLVIKSFKTRKVWSHLPLMCEHELIISERDSIKTTASSFLMPIASLPIQRENETKKLGNKMSKAREMDNLAFENGSAKAPLFLKLSSCASLQENSILNLIVVVVRVVEASGSSYKNLLSVYVNDDSDTLTLLLLSDARARKFSNVPGDLLMLLDVELSSSSASASAAAAAAETNHKYLLFKKNSLYLDMRENCQFRTAQGLSSWWKDHVSSV